MGFAKLAVSFLRSPAPGLTIMPKDGRRIGLELIEFWIWIGTYRIVDFDWSLYRILDLNWIK